MPETRTAHAEVDLAVLAARIARQHVADVVDVLNELPPEFLDPASRKLLQTATLRRLIASAPAASILSVAPDRNPIVVTPMADREDVARLITKYDLLAVPVVMIPARCSAS